MPSSPNCDKTLNSASLSWAVVRVAVFLPRQHFTLQRHRVTDALMHRIDEATHGLQ
jgi:hypothetical protein